MDISDLSYHPRCGGSIILFPQTIFLLSYNRLPPTLHSRKFSIEDIFRKHTSINFNLIRYNKSFTVLLDTTILAILIKCAFYN